MTAYNVLTLLYDSSLDILFYRGNGKVAFNPYRWLIFDHIAYGDGWTGDATDEKVIYYSYK